MKQTLQQIQALQDMSRKAAQTRRDRDALTADVREQEHAVSERQRGLEQAHQRRLDAAKQADAAQMRIEQAEEELERLQAQLNLARSQRDYDTLQSSILSHRADIQRWEDECLSTLQAVDQLTGEEARAREELRQAQERLTQVRQEVAEQSAELNRALAETEADRAEMRDAINPDVLSIYDRLAVSRRSSALALVKGRVCQGCFTTITKQTENLLMRGQEIVCCPSCGRMLMLPE
jgi:predicted  nucleic acid-binding Zn-ribbon protein